MHSFWKVQQTASPRQDTIWTKCSLVISGSLFATYTAVALYSYIKCSHSTVVAKTTRWFNRINRFSRRFSLPKKARNKSRNKIGSTVFKTVFKDFEILPICKLIVAQMNHQLQIFKAFNSRNRPFSWVPEEYDLGVDKLLFWIFPWWWSWYLVHCCHCR